MVKILSMMQLNLSNKALWEVCDQEFGSRIMAEARVPVCDKVHDRPFILEAVLVPIENEF